MPFASQKQRAYLYARHPGIAKRWRKESGPQRDLPERTARSSKRERMVRGFMNKQKARHGR